MAVPPERYSPVLIQEDADLSLAHTTYSRPTPPSPAFRTGPAHTCNAVEHAGVPLTGSYASWQSNWGIAMVSSTATEQHARPPPQNHRLHHDAGQDEPPTARQPESACTGRWRQHPPVSPRGCEQRYGTLRATRTVRGQEREPRTTRQPLQTTNIPDAGDRQGETSHPPHCSLCRTLQARPVAGVVDCARPTPSAINADTGMAAGRLGVAAEER